MASANDSIPMSRESFVVKLRKKFYENVDQLQMDLDGYLKDYRERATQGYRCKRRMLYRAITSRTTGILVLWCQTFGNGRQIFIVGANVILGIILVGSEH